MYDHYKCEQNLNFWEFKLLKTIYIVKMEQYYVQEAISIITVL